MCMTGHKGFTDLFLERGFPPVGSLGTLPLGIAHKSQFPGCWEPIFEASVCMELVI